MKFRLCDGEMRLINATSSYSSSSISIINNVNYTCFIVDRKDLQRAWKQLKKDWFGDKATMRVMVGTGIFWGAFMSYIFPIMLDIAKVFCAFKIAQAFYEERSGSVGRDSKSGFQALAYWGRWYIVFWLIPYGVELIDQLGGKMYTELLKDAATNKFMK